jgi:hypothetical protein
MYQKLTFLIHRRAHRKISASVRSAAFILDTQYVDRGPAEYQPLLGYALERKSEPSLPMAEPDNGGRTRKP